MKQKNKPKEPNKKELSTKKTITRRHRKVILFNDKELEALELYCKKYRITSQSRFCREAIISTILKQMEEDHPKLF